MPSPEPASMMWNVAIIVIAPTVRFVWLISVAQLKDVEPMRTVQRVSSVTSMPEFVYPDLIALTMMIAAMMNAVIRVFVNPSFVEATMIVTVAVPALQAAASHRSSVSVMRTVRFQDYRASIINVPELVAVKVTMIVPET